MERVLEGFAPAVADRYRLERELGRGGTATVFLAQELRHGRLVAVKVLDPQIAASLGRARFLREIEIAARLVHPHILSLLDSGEAAGFLYYVTPYMPEDSLRARLRREGELPVEEAVRILREILDALSYAHDQGIVHRDIKPENVLFAGGHVQVADFGVAKALDAAGQASSLTATGLALGTPGYMAPEQAAGEAEIDHRADIYSAGIVAYEMLAGAPPFAAPDARQLAAAHLFRSPEPLDRLRPAVPAALGAVVMRCLAKRPADRWASCAEMSRELERVFDPGSEGVTALWTARELQKASFRLTEEVCRRLDRSSFDPRLIGDSLQYLDNRASSEVMVFCLPACGLDAEEFAPFLRATRYRALALTPLGFEPERRRRPVLSVPDHLVLVEEWMQAMVAALGPRWVVLVGFSSGADVALRAAAQAGDASPLQLDACLSLGSNLGLETCFVTRAVAALESDTEEDTLDALRTVGQSAGTLDDWLNLHDYLIQIAKKFRGRLEPLQVFARGIVQPFEGAPLVSFVDWYREARRRGRRLRCVFDDSPMYHGLIRELHLRNLDERLLGDGYEEDSILIDPETGHFDLLQPARIEGHLDVLVARLRRG